MELTASDYYILLFLRENPFSQLTELARALDVAPNTVKARINRLKQEGVIRDDRMTTDPILGERRVSETVAYPAYNALGLRSTPVILKGVSSESALEDIYKYLDRHPYTVYRGFGFSTEPMVYVQFSMPDDPEGYLQEFIEELRKRNLFREALVFPYPTHITTKDRLEYWDHHFQKWRYDARTLRIDKVSETYSALKRAHFSPVDLLVLRELTINAKVKIKELTEYHSYDRTTLSRHVKFVKENLVQGYGILYDRRLFDISNYRIFWGRFREGSPLGDLRDGKFPFNSSFAQEGNRFIWMVHAPDVVLNDLSLHLFGNTEELMQAVLYPETGLRYYFYHKNYDTENKSWRYSRDYLLEQIF